MATEYNTPESQDLPRKEQLHLHVWPADEAEWDSADVPEDADFTYRDTYPNMEGYYDGYHQFGVTLSDGRYLELRIPLVDFRFEPGKGK